MTLPLNVVAEDHSLEKKTEGAARALILLRWHWTLDESNPDRVSLKEYARQVDVAEPTIRRDAHAGEMLQGESAGALSPNDARERASMGTETAAATEAVAKLHGLSVKQTRLDRGDEVRHVRDTARQRAEEKGTTTLVEMPDVAAMHGRLVKAAKATKAERQRNNTLRYIRMEARLSKASRQLLGALKESEGVDFDAEERALLTETIENVRRLLKLLDRAILDKYDESWKAELQVLAGGLAS